MSFCDDNLCVGDTAPCFARIAKFRFHDNFLQLFNAEKISRWFEDLLRSRCATGWPRYVSLSKFYTLLLYSLSGVPYFDFLCTAAAETSPRGAKD